MCMGLRKSPNIMPPDGACCFFRVGFSINIPVLRTLCDRANDI
jgi:hypothetical protein